MRPSSGATWSCPATTSDPTSRTPLRRRRFGKCRAGGSSSRPAPTVRRRISGRGPEAMLDAVGMEEINKIFAVTDALGIHRESVVIPLGPGKGRVRKLLNGKLEIIVDAVVPIDEWLQGLPELIQAAQSR